MMAKTLEQLGNKVRIKFLVRPQKYFLFYGNRQCMIDGEYQKGYNTIEEARKVGNNSYGKGYYRFTDKNMASSRF